MAALKGGEMVSPLPGRTSGSAGERKRLLFGAAALLLVLDAALLGVWAVRRAAYSRRSPEARVAGMFATLRRRGLAAALDTLERAAAADSMILRDAHQLAHALGREAVRASGGAATPLAACRPAFASGCYHGVIEAYLAAHGRIDMPALERLCAAAGSTERPGPIAECTHGLGHGVLGAVDLDVDSALRYCDALVRPGAGTWCYAGVFMEAVNAAAEARATAGHHVHGGVGAIGSIPGADRPGCYPDPTAVWRSTRRIAIAPVIVSAIRMPLRVGSSRDFCCCAAKVSTSAARFAPATRRRAGGPAIVTKGLDSSSPVFFNVTMPGTLPSARVEWRAWRRGVRRGWRGPSTAWIGRGLGRRGFAGWRRWRGKVTAIVPRGSC